MCFYSSSWNTVLIRQVQSVLQDVSTLQSHIPNLSTACHSFAVQAKEITQKRKVSDWESFFIVIYYYHSYYFHA
jgi:hypothetical protein